MSSGTEIKKERANLLVDQIAAELVTRIRNVDLSIQQIKLAKRQLYLKLHPTTKDDLTVGNGVTPSEWIEEYIRLQCVLDEALRIRLILTQVEQDFS